jgi:hypothetical protein
MGTGITQFIRHPYKCASYCLTSPNGHPDHLKQNYLIDIIVPGVDDGPTISSPWTRNFEAVFNSLRRPVNDNERQVDSRLPGARAAGVEDEEEDPAE